jgi:hypothetical protein
MAKHSINHYSVYFLKTTMDKVVLKFGTPQSLASFTDYAGDAVYKTDLANLIVYCNSTPQLITLAVKQLEAIVIDLPNN